MLSKKIKVLIADKSEVTRNMIRIILGSDSGIEIAGETPDGREAVKLASSLRPSIIIMDLDLEYSGGRDPIREIMCANPIPILVMGTSSDAASSQKAFAAISNGAMEVIERPKLSAALNIDQRAGDFLKKVKMLAGADVKTPFACSIKSEPSAALSVPHDSSPGYDIVAIASSTGGPGALSKILKIIPDDFPAGIVITQHISDGFDSSMADWLNSISGTRVRIAKNNDIPAPGHALICPTNRQMRLERKNRITLADEPPFNGYRPSGDILFSSAAKTYGKRAVGVILTGMGADGAAGMKEMKDAGAYTIAQDETTSVVFGMPAAAMELGAVTRVARIDEIAHLLVYLLKK